MSVVPAAPEHADAWARMRADLWPEASVAAHRAEIEQFFGDPDQRDPTLQAALIHLAAGGQPDGFVELSVRAVVDRCEGAAGYVEGWFVTEQARRSGVGAALIRAAEEWARHQGLRTLASDTTLDNATSQRAHSALGFRETDRIVQYLKDL